MKTSERLAQALHAAGLFGLEERARQNEFSDFASPHAMPKVALVQELNKAIFEASTMATGGYDAPIFMLKRAVINGEFDDTKEEAEAWFEREGKHLLKEKE